MVLIIEERLDCLAKIREELGDKKDIVLVTTRIAGFVRMIEPGKDYQVVICNGQQVVGEKARMELIDKNYWIS